MPILESKLRIRCPEGFSYHGFQRCIIEAYIDGDGWKKQANITKPVVDLFNKFRVMNTPAADLDADDILWLSEDGACCFALSGESFTLEDLAMAISDVTGLDVKAG